jgi:hypothetical protein
MGWHWEATASGISSDASPPDLAQPASGFPSQSEAETWLGEVWRDLLERGLDSVTLLEDGRVVYGPMSLRPTEQ